MEKIKIELDKIDYIAFKFKDKEIFLKPYISVLDKVTITMEYLSILFDNEDTNISGKYFIAEYALILQIIDILSNVDVSDVDADSVIYSGLWDEIKKRISNYESFKYDLNRVILFYQNEKNLEISVGAVLERFANKAIESIEKLSTLDSKELKETSETFVNALNKLNEAVPGITKGNSGSTKKVKDKKQPE